MRTELEVFERYCQNQRADVFGFGNEVLFFALSYGVAASQKEVRHLGNEEEWETTYRFQTDEDVKAAAYQYYTFTLGKLDDHRSLSASRSFYKLSAYAWLLGRDDIVEAMKQAPSKNYYAPAVKIFAEGMGFLWPDYEPLNRMAQGLKCCNTCTDCS